MRRFLTILSALLFSLAGFAQEVEMFSLEREISIPGVQKEDLQERAFSWLRTLGSVPASEYDVLTPLGYRTDWIRRVCSISYKGRDYQTEYCFTLSIIATEDGQCTVRLYRPMVSSHRGNKTILSADNLPVFYGGYTDGMFGAARNKEARIYICDKVKRLLTEEFETMIPPITETLEGRVAPWEFVQE
jgi:hypothetical protein